MKIVSFNVNSLRKRLESGQFQAMIAKHKPDIVGLQETKVRDEEFPLSAIEALGYECVFFGEQIHYGVALLSKQRMEKVYRGFPDDGPDKQRRLIGAAFPLADGRRLSVINGYFPQGENRAHPIKFPYKQWFYARIMQHLNEQHKPNDLLAVIGDMNIAPQDVDVGLGEDNAKRWLATGKCAFLPEEREMLSQLTDWGLMDSFRVHQPENTNTYSWFDYRSRGFDADPKRGLRIDLIMTTASLQKCCVDTGIDYAIRGLKTPSDHAPVWATFDLG